MGKNRNQLSILTLLPRTRFPALCILRNMILQRWNLTSIRGIQKTCAHLHLTMCINHSHKFQVVINISISPGHAQASGNTRKQDWVAVRIFGCFCKFKTHRTADDSQWLRSVRNNKSLFSIHVWNVIKLKDLVLRDLSNNWKLSPSTLRQF